MTELINKCIDYVKENTLQAIIIAALAVFILAILIVIVALSVKRSKARKKLAREAEAKAAQEKAETEKAAAKAKAEKEEAEKEAARKAVVERLEAERIAAEKEEAEKQAAEKAEAERIATEKAIAEKQAEQKKESAAKKTATAKKATAAKKTTAKKTASENAVLYDEMKDAEVEDEVWYDESETDKAARYKGKWLICRVVTEDGAEAEEMYFFELHASNGEKLLSSEEYTSYAGALRGIETHKANIEKGNFRITLSKKGDYIFKLLSGKNMLLCMGENYPTKIRCENAIESTKRFAKTAVIDENVQDHVIKVPVEDDTEIEPVSEGYNGKWLISGETGADGEQVYRFELFANNGEKLLASEEYTTYIGAVNGIQTHKANIEKGNFRISLTKRGDYIYKLLNGNGQLLCLGEHYKTKRLCLNAVESVKRFAVNSPVLTEANLAK